VTALIANAALFLALVAAPLALGSYVVVQRASPRTISLWFGGLAALLLLGLLTGAFGLVLAFLS
jgi:predicted lipid-binding transport protein (Tim44 family)